MHVLALLSVVLVTLTSGCTTPPEIKQAVAAKEVAYAENARLMTIHRELLESIDTRYWYWYRHAKKLALLNQALKWATTDPEPETGKSEASYVFATRLSLQNKSEEAPAKVNSLIALINRVRLKDLRQRKLEDGTVVFEAGHGDMNKLVHAIPEMIEDINKNVEAEFAKDNQAADYSAFDDYQTNLAALRRINGMIKRYLDIDVTVKREDVQQLAESVKALTLEGSLRCR